MTKKTQIKTANLSRFMVYILGHRPDEFVLVPDEEGYVKIKELLQAMHEEEGWGYVRHGHLREVLLSSERIHFEADEHRIKARDRRWELDLGHPPCRDLPKLLFHPVRQRAHPHVMEKGLAAGTGENLVLTPLRETALRLGLRRDHKPVVLEISVEQARKSSVDFFAFGDLFLVSRIPPGAILGPPVSRDFEKARPKDIKEEPLPVPDFHPGTFILDNTRDPYTGRKDNGPGRKQRGWKEEARKIRRGKK